MLLSSTMEFKAFRAYFQRTVESKQNALTEHSFIVDVPDAEPEACWERADQDVEVEEEGDPRRRLVFRHRRYDGDVDLCIAGEGESRRDAIHVGLSECSDKLHIRSS